MSIFVIAEIGINHNGSMEITKQLIDMAKDAGCDAVKFQKRTIDMVYTPAVLDTPRESPWGTTTREQKMGLEFGVEDYKEIDRYCKDKKIEWFASAWDVESQKFLRQFNCKYNKIASAMLTHAPLLKEVASEKLHTSISTGMATYAEIDAAVAIFKEAGCPFTLMHTVSVYPCPEEDLNLNMIKTLSDKYKCPVGYSGHETSPVPSIAAAAMGITALERHITLDRTMYGSDQSASLEKRGLEILVSGVRSVEKALGKGQKEFGDAEKAVAAKLRYW
jgi:N-acetylneuraminate synthase